MEPRFTFNQVASVYKAARPDYPETLIDDVVSYAGLKPNDAILEVGCGTGQATKSFAARGYSILAIDPGSEMVRAARKSLAKFANVKLIETTFEEWPAERGAFRLVIAAQSWHWVSPEMRFAKAAEVLWPDGSLAVFGHVPVGLPAPLLEQFKQIYLRHTGHWGPPPEAHFEFPDFGAQTQQSRGGARAVRRGLPRWIKTKTLKPSKRSRLKHLLRLSAPSRFRRSPRVLEA